MITMAPPTCLNPFRSPTPELLAGKEADTIRKSWYFDALDHKSSRKSQASIAKDYSISKSYRRK